MSDLPQSTGSRGGFDAAKIHRLLCSEDSADFNAGLRPVLLGAVDAGFLWFNGANWIARRAENAGQREALADLALAIIFPDHWPPQAE